MAAVALAGRARVLSGCSLDVQDADGVAAGWLQQQQLAAAWSSTATPHGWLSCYSCAPVNFYNLQKRASRWHAESEIYL
jgi:hypothetical protein